MAVLKAAARKASATVVVGGKPKFPIPDKGHAKAALARLNQAKPPLSPAQKAKVEDRADRVLGIKQGSPADKRRDAKTGDPQRPIHRTFIHTGKRNGTTRLRPAK